MTRLRRESAPPARSRFEQSDGLLGHLEEDCEVVDSEFVRQGVEPCYCRPLPTYQMSHRPPLLIINSVVVIPGSQAFTAVPGLQNTTRHEATTTALPHAEVTALARESSLMSDSTETSEVVKLDFIGFAPRLGPKSCAKPLCGISSMALSKYLTKVAWPSLTSDPIVFSIAVALAAVRAVLGFTPVIEGHPAPELTAFDLAATGFG